jgi:hypothetical protein
MANTTFGSTAGSPLKKETVYNGPSPQTKQGTVQNGPSPAAGGTVYDGPAMKPAGGGTVYGGPGQSNTAGGGPAGAGTVYRSAPQPAATGNAATRPAARGASIFFLIAAFSAVNTLLVLGGSHTVLGIGLTVSKFGQGVSVPAILVLNVIAIGIFVLLGIFARNGSKAAFILGMLLYGGDGLMLYLSGDPAAHIPGLVVHGIFLITMFKGLTQLQNETL